MSVHIQELVDELVSHSEVEARSGNFKDYIPVYIRTSVHDGKKYLIEDLIKKHGMNFDNERFWNILRKNYVCEVMYMPRETMEVH